MFRIEFHRNNDIDWHVNNFHYSYETYDYVFIENNKFVKLVFMIPTIIATYPNKSWWRHQMETFSALLAICAGNSPVTGEFPAQRPVTRSFDVFFDLRLNKRLNNHKVSDLRRYHAHYNVTVMTVLHSWVKS